LAFYDDFVETATQSKKKGNGNMKKLIALLLVLCFSVAAITAFGEEAPEKTYADEHPGVLAFDSYWVSGDAKIRIDADHTDDGYEIVVIEMTGENTFNSWEYLLTYDEETKSLVADGNGMKSSNVFDGTWTITDSRYEYEDGGARFFINDKDQLCWLDEKESTFHTTVFHRIGRFPGVFTSGPAKLKVNWAGEDLIYDVQLDMPENASQAWQWTLSGNYTPAANTLVLNGFRLLYTYKADGALDLDADKLAEEVNAVFAFDKEGYLVCTESTDPAIMGIRFELDPESYGMWAWEF
jgi:hypothetical protein